MSSPNVINGEVYPRIKIQCAEGLRSFHKLLCCHFGCKETLLLSPGQRGRLNNDAVIKFAKQKGWFADKKGYVLCPVHNFTGRKSHPGNKNMKPAAKQAAFLSIRDKENAAKMAELRKADNDQASIPLVVSPIEEEPLASQVAEPPRIASREDKRRIRIFLDEHYDEDKGCWIKDWNDGKAAVKLAVPRAWVSSIRDEFYGPDQSEADFQTSVQAKELISFATKLKDDALAIATRAEELERRARKLLKE